MWSGSVDFVAVCFLGGLQAFTEWIQRNGPFDVMIDGANVALWGENYEGGGFRPDKIKLVHDVITAQHPQSKVLLVSTSRCCQLQLQEGLLHISFMCTHESSCLCGQCVRLTAVAARK
jgi:hypothetical protein